MASPAPSTETTLKLRRTFKAPREKVFRAWTDPEELKNWWGAEGYETVSAEVDLLCGPKLKPLPIQPHSPGGESEEGRRPAPLGRVRGEGRGVAAWLASPRAFPAN